MLLSFVTNRIPSLPRKTNLSACVTNVFGDNAIYCEQQNNGPGFCPKSALLLKAFGEKMN
jgi:hypothetical protein